MISLTLQKIIFLRFWKFFLQSYAVVALIWVFSICVKLFIRQEIVSFQLLLIISLSTLPSILPYITCLAAMFTILNFGKTHELKLMTLMGISRISRLGHFLLAFPILPLLAFLFEAHWKPDLKMQLNSPASLMGRNMLEKIPRGTEIDLDNWLLSRNDNGGLFMARQENNKTTVILASDLSAPDTAQHQLVVSNGKIWPDMQSGAQVLQFKDLHLPLVDHAMPSSREKRLAELNPHNSAELNQMFLIARNTLAPIFLLYLGISLGHLALVTSKGVGFLTCLLVLLAVYFPLQILSRNAHSTRLVIMLFLQCLPLLTVFITGRWLNHYSEKRGCG